MPTPNPCQRYRGDDTMRRRAPWLAVALLVGCGGGDSPPPDPTLATHTASAPARPVAPAGPQIAHQPVAVVAPAGQVATLEVVAVGRGLLGYQWYRNGEAVAGATGARWTWTPDESDDGATFHVVVHDADGQTRSHPVSLQIDHSTTDQP